MSHGIMDLSPTMSQFRACVFRVAHQLRKFGSIPQEKTHRVFVWTLIEACSRSGEEPARSVVLFFSFGLFSRQVSRLDPEADAGEFGKVGQWQLSLDMLSFGGLKTSVQRVDAFRPFNQQAVRISPQNGATASQIQAACIVARGGRKAMCCFASFLFSFGLLGLCAFACLPAGLLARVPLLGRLFFFLRACFCLLQLSLPGLACFACSALTCLDLPSLALTCLDLP